MYMNAVVSARASSHTSLPKIMVRDLLPISNTVKAILLSYLHVYLRISSFASYDCSIIAEFVTDPFVSKPPNVIISRN